MITTEVITANSRRVSEVYSLRYKIFQEQLGWIPENKQKLDHDAYDSGSLSICVRDNQTILATARITPPDETFMIEDDFAYLFESDEHNKFLKDLQLRKKQSIEISRLGVDPSIQDKKIRSKAALTLYKEVYKWCRQNKARYIYFVSTEKLLDSLTKRYGIPIVKISGEHKTGEGFKYYAGVIDIHFLRNPISMLRFVFSFILK